MITIFSKYVLQNVLAMVGISVYILADTFFISMYAGADGLAVLNLILPLYGLIYAIGAMIGIGSATGFSIKNARKERTDFHFSQSVLWSLIASVPFMLLGLVFPDKVLSLLGADEGLISLGGQYIQIILLAAPLFMVNYTFTAFLRNDYAPKVIK